jgi:hypothetical protein
MKTTWTKEQNLLDDAVREIKSLKRSNELMRARLDMFDDCIALLSAQVNRQGMGMSPDISWEIEQHLASLDSIPPKP